MAVAALVLYALWFVLAFGLRTAIQLRRTGDSGMRWPPGRVGSAEWLAGVGFGLALLVGVAAPIAEIAGVDPLDVLDAPWLRWTGAVVAVVGVGLTVAAQLSMGDSWRIGVDETETTSLVTGGPFAMARNPIFSAMIVTAAGLVAMVPNVLAVAGLVALAVALEVQVRLVEEPYLRRTHGNAYREYASRVGRFAPFLGRTR